MNLVTSSGPDNADILIVGEHPTKDDVVNAQPFMGQAGVLLNKILNEAGIARSECFLTFVCKHAPPRNRIENWIYTKGKKQEDSRNLNGKWVHPNIMSGAQALMMEIDIVKPKVIIALGNLSLLALTGESGITKWRGSGMEIQVQGKVYPLIASFDIPSILRTWSRRFLTVHDIRKAKRVSEKGLPKIIENFIIRPSFEIVLAKLDYLLYMAKTSEKLVELAIDLETKTRQITCLGIGWSSSDALCIPFLEVTAEDGNYWKSLEEELEIVLKLRTLLTHSNVKILGQNFPYDQQYIAKYWGFLPNINVENFHDTMTAHHVMWPGLPKGLDFLSSMYLDNHLYWKDEGKEWNPKTMDEEQLWIYNCKDCVRTYSIAQEQYHVYRQLGFRKTNYGTPHEIQHKIHEPVLRAMLRGVEIDLGKRKHLQDSLAGAVEKREAYLEFILGHPINPRSPKQLQTLFYEDFKVRPVTTYDRSTGKRRRTTNEEALQTIGKREILLTPVTQAINEVRSLGTFKAVVNQSLDNDNRIRCQYIIPGTETFRFASMKDAFGLGTNLQNISEGNEKYILPDSPFFKPNLRKMMVPGKRKVIGKFDGKQADARVVARESNEESLLEIFADPDRDIHNENCAVIYGDCTGDKDPRRQLSKIGIHATNYGAVPSVVARSLGITNHAAEKFQSRYFQERPNIKDWHNKVLDSIQTKRYVENVFGYRRYYFDRIENLLKEALAWIPQSTVAISINIGTMNVLELYGDWADFVLQVHDESDFVYANDSQVTIRTEKIRKAMEIALPYDSDPNFTIPIDAKVSDISWGDCG